MNEAPEIIEEIEETEDALKEVVLAEDLSDLDWKHLDHLAMNCQEDGFSGEGGWLLLYMEGGV
jgi:hypothetical protein